jgi:3-dehydroquinate dehydratase type I
MTSLGDLQLLAGKPVIAVSFTDIDSAADIAEAKAAGVGIAELRIDLFARHDPAYVAAQMGRLKGLPRLATIRIAAEGGDWKGSEDDRIDVYETILPLVDGIDIELQATHVLERLAPQASVNNKLLVVSHHDFEGTPPYDVLAEVAYRGAQSGANIVKIAAQVNSDADIGVLARLLEENAAPNLVVIGMGEVGKPTRLLFPMEGSLFTFAAKGDRATAPGQMAYGRMAALLGITGPEQVAEP